MKPGRHWTAALLALLLLAGAPEALGQWVMVGRAAANRVRRMTHSGTQGYDVATVLLEAPAERVYDGALKTLQARPDITITRQDRKNGKIEFRKGELVAGLQVSSLGEKVSQVVIASGAADASQPSATSLVVEGVLRVCEEMKVQCTLQAE